MGCKKHMKTFPDCGRGGCVGGQYVDIPDKERVNSVS